MRFLWKWACLALGLTVVALLANGLVAAQTLNPSVQLPEAVDVVVVEYNLIHHMIAKPDPEPLMRIHADGRVRIHYPVYMARAGDYELKFSNQELSALINGLVAEGMMEFHGASAMQERQLAVETQRATGVLYHVSDVTETVIQIRLGSYLPPGAARAIVNPQQLVRWRNLHMDARQYPEAASVQKLARSVERLDAILN